MATDGTSEASAVPSVTAAARWWAVAILLLTLMSALVWSHYKLFWDDELLEFYSDSKPTLSAVVYGQLHYPFSLEPPGFHLLLHVMLRIIPSPELALRLISMVSILVTEVCVFRIAYRYTREETVALLAMALPFFLATVDYAAEGRVYSPMVALFAVAMVCYQSAIGSERRRGWALAGVFVSLSLGILSHYYAIFLPLPLVVGEVLRTVRRRRIDWLMVGAIVGPFLVFALNVPFQKPLHEIQAHYYLRETTWSYIFFTYEWLFGHFGVYNLSRFGSLAPALCYLSALLGSVGVGIAVVRRARRNWRVDAQMPVWGALSAAMFFPYLNLIVAHFVTHAYSMRYSLPTVVAISVVFPCLFVRWIPRRRYFFPLLGLLLGVSCVYVGRHVETVRAEGVKTLNDLKLSPSMAGTLAVEPDGHLYVGINFLTVYYYAPPGLKERLVETYSPERELFWWHHNPASIFGRNLHITTGIPSTTFEALRQKPGPHLLVVYPDSKDEQWMDKEIDKETAEGAAQVQVLGPALGGVVYRVTFLEPK